MQFIVDAAGAGGVPVKSSRPVCIAQLHIGIEHMDLVLGRPNGGATLSAL
jgi:hypothetical protein